MLVLWRDPSYCHSVRFIWFSLCGPPTGSVFVVNHYYYSWNFSDSKSPQVSRTLLSILAVFNNIVVWMVSTRPFISNSSTLFINLLVTVPKAPIIIGINVTFMIHSFFSSLVCSIYLYFFSLSFSFTQWSAGTAKSTIQQVLFFLFFFFRLLL